MAEEAALPVIEELLPGAAEEVGLTSAAEAAVPAVAATPPVESILPEASNQSAAETNRLLSAERGIQQTQAPIVNTGVDEASFGPLGATSRLGDATAYYPSGASLSIESQYPVPADPGKAEALTRSLATPTSVSSAGSLAPAADTEFVPTTEPTAEETLKKIAKEQGTQGFDATKALEYLGLTKPGGGLGSNALPAAALGLSQYRANKTGQALQDQLKAASAQVQPVASSLINQYETGQINPAQEKQITDLTNNTKARIKQRYAQMGRDPNTDSAAQSELAKADADAVAMRDAAQQGILTQGLQAAGLAQGPATSAVMAGYQSDLQQHQAMQNFMNTLALMQSKTATP